MGWDDAIVLTGHLASPAPAVLTHVTCSSVGPPILWKNVEGNTGRTRVRSVLPTCPSVPSQEPPEGPPAGTQMAGPFWGHGDTREPGALMGRVACNTSHVRTQHVRAKPCGAARPEG